MPSGSRRASARTHPPIGCISPFRTPGEPHLTSPHRGVTFCSPPPPIPLPKGSFSPPDVSLMQHTRATLWIREEGKMPHTPTRHTRPRRARRSRGRVRCASSEPCEPSPHPTSGQVLDGKNVVIPSFKGKSEIEKSRFQPAREEDKGQGWQVLQLLGPAPATGLVLIRIVQMQRATATSLSANPLSVCLREK